MPTEALDDFGGLSTTLTAVLLEPGDATKAEFCELNDGVLETALGRAELFAAVAAGAGAVTTIIDWRRLDGSSFVLVFTTADIFKVNFALKTFVSIKPVAYTITGTRAWSWAYATLADKIVFTNGEDAPLEWDGVASLAVLFTLPANVTKPKFVLWWKNRLHLFGTTDLGASKPYRHWWSELFLYNAWLTANGAGFLDYSAGGEPINAVAGLENLVLLLKQTRATVVAHTGVSTAPFASRDMETIKGTYAPFSVQVASVGVFYLAVDGLRLFDGSSSRLVSEHVDAFSNIPITALTLTSSVLDSVFKRYLVAIPSVVGGKNDRVWNVLYQSYPEDRMEFSNRVYTAPTEIRSLGRFIRSEQFTWQSFANDATGQWDVQTITWTDPKTSGEFDELVAGGYAGQVWLFEDQASDLGVAIPLVWQTGVLPPKVSRQLTRLRWLSVSGIQAINSTITIDVLDADTEEVRFSTVIDFATKRATVVHPNRSFPGGFMLRLRNTALGSIPVIDQLRYEYLPGVEGRK